MGRPRKTEVKPEKKKATMTRKLRAKKQESDPMPEPKKKRGRGRPPKSEISTKEVQQEKEKFEDRLCRKDDCEFFDASFRGNCLMGPIPEGDCLSYMLADPIREVPKIESAVIIGHVLQIPLDRDPELVGWVRKCSRPKLLMLMLRARNLLYEQMELDRFIGQEAAAVKEERVA